MSTFIRTTDPVEIKEWVKTRGYITLHHFTGEDIILHRALFEAWVDKMEKRLVSCPNPNVESTAEDIRQMSWDEYYQDEFIELDFLQYLKAGRVLKDIYSTIDKLTA